MTSLVRSATTKADDDEDDGDYDDNWDGRGPVDFTRDPSFFGDVGGSDPWKTLYRNLQP